MNNNNSDVIILPDGGRYCGDVSDAGLPEGASGIGIWKNKGLKYIGHWCDGMMHGTGTMYYSDGREVHGVWYEGSLIYEFIKDYDNPITSENNNSFTPPAEKQKITALLIGNNDYPENPLHNCIYDVEAIGEKLQSMGIDVKILKNATKNQMERAINELSEKSEYYSCAMFYYSGHGNSNQGRHYLSAIDEFSVDSPMLSLEKIDEILSSRDYEGIIIVSDACCTIVNVEGNPNKVDNTGKALIALSTTLGHPSYDFRKPNSHSPFATGLLEYIDKPLEIGQMFREVNRLTRAFAEREIGRIQMPNLNIQSGFPTNFYLCPF